MALAPNSWTPKMDLVWQNMANANSIDLTEVCCECMRVQYILSCNMPIIWSYLVFYFILFFHISIVPILFGTSVLTKPLISFAQIVRTGGGDSPILNLLASRWEHHCHVPFWKAQRHPRLQIRLWEKPWLSASPIEDNAAAWWNKLIQNWWLHTWCYFVRCKGVWNEIFWSAQNGLLDLSARNDETWRFWCPPQLKLCNQGYNTKRNKQRVVKTPGGRAVFQTLKKKAKGPHCHWAASQPGKRKLQVWKMMVIWFLLWMDGTVDGSENRLTIWYG